MVGQPSGEVKQLFGEARRLNIRPPQVLLAIPDDAGRLKPQAVVTVDGFLDCAGDSPGVFEICRTLVEQNRRGPFVGLLHSAGAVLFELPKPIVKAWVQPIVTPELIARAIWAGTKPGETFVVVRHDDGTFSVSGRRATAKFVRRWRHCFEKTNLPSADKIYLAIVHPDGVFVTAI